MNLRQHLATTRMSRAQWIVVAACALLSALDGYDVLAMSFTSNAVSAELGLSGTDLGLVLGAAGIGAGVGSLVFGPIGDRIGRRPALLASLILSTIGVALTAGSNDLIGLITWRLVTGIGVGGSLAAATVLASEFANERRHGLVLSLFTAGFPVGGALGGLAAAPIIQTVGWHGVFILGAALNLLVLAVAVSCLPESIAFLSERAATHPKHARALDRLIERLDITESVTVEPAPREHQAAGAFAGLFAPRYLTTTLAVWITFFTLQAAYQFASSWTPKLLVKTGLSPEQGIFAVVAISIGGIVGALCYGALTAKWSARSVFASLTAFASIALVAFILTTSIVPLAFTAALLVGFFLNAAIAGIYTTAPTAYGPSLRSTGVGVALGIGKIGGIASPIVVGALLDGGVTPVALYLGTAVFLLAAIIGILRIRQYREEETSAAVRPRAESAELVEEERYLLSHER